LADADILSREDHAHIDLASGSEAATCTTDVAGGSWRTWRVPPPVVRGRSRGLCPNGERPGL